jgi:hypothetical protein
MMPVADLNCKIHSELIALFPCARPEGCLTHPPAGRGRAGGEEMTDADLRDLQELAEKLLAKARELPAGSEREEALREIASYRARLDAISAKMRSKDETK